VGHLPCSFRCEASTALGRRFAELGRAAGVLGVDELEELLASPLTVSALHGIAQVRAPDFKVTYGTDYTPSIVRFERQSGLTSAFDNGFIDDTAMREAHLLVREAARRALEQSAKTGLIVDLGCGDGALLASLGHRDLLGVECVESRIRRGRARNPDVTFLEGKLTEVVLPEPRSLVLIAVQRLKSALGHRTSRPRTLLGPGSCGADRT
jgi:hypothetical protein